MTKELVVEQELPKGWRVLSIEDCLAPINGKKKVGQGWSPQCEKEASPTDAQWGVLKTTAIQAGQFLAEENKLLPANLEPRPQIEVKSGDLLTTCAGPRSRCGVTCLVRETRPRLMISGKMYRYRADKGVIDSEYLEAYLQTQDAWDAIDKMKTGGSDSGLNLTHDRFLQLPIPVAALPEQRRIVSAIETQLGRLDAAVARLHAAKAKLKRYKQAVLKAAFSEGEPTRLEELCEFITKGTTPTKTMFGEKGTVPFIKVYNLTRDGSLDFTVDPTFIEQSVHEKFLARSIVYPGDLLMNIVGPPLGKVSLVPDDYPEWNINQAIVRYRTKEKLRTKYLMYYLLCDSTAQELMATTKATAGQFNLTLAHCRDLQIPLIPIDEQDFLIEHLEQRLGVIDETEATLDAQLLQSTRLRQAVLKRAFEGKLV